MVSLKRDYLCNLSVEKRNFLNEKNIQEYNNCLNDLQGLFSESVDSMFLLDTSDISLNDVSIKVTSRILPVMRKKYIKALEQKYNLIQK